ncbi:Ger(x)C family spore germination protein [Ectobacillus ponti]|uniref:Ger(X)C family spore germination protein n=1 Tax=Ectobacillus ponti TaxID=2961894 RepID=A0AA41X6S7_9BACI|nr:Ger(x)C family spore germination protein [Ectobacillus ponti]MCP8967880.1 Ger(x)C family spore germination protein [Ectobacillus ponti]
MIRKLLVVLTSLVLLVPLTGCWNRRELNELAIAVGLAIDKVGDNRYLVSVQVVDPGEVGSRQGGSGRAPVTVYQQESDTVFEALRKITMISPRKIYLSHLRIVVIGESVAREGIAKSVEFLSRDHEVRTDFFLILAHNVPANMILKFVSPIEKIPAQKLYKSLEVAEKVWAPAHTVQLDDLISSMMSDGKAPVLTVVKYTGDQKIGQTKANVERTKMAAHLKYTNLAVLRGDKLVGWLDEKQSKGLSYLDGKVQNTVGSFNCPKGGSIAGEIYNAVPKIQARFRNGKPYIVVHNKIEVNVGEVRCNVDLTDVKQIRDLAGMAAKSNEDILNASIKQAQKLQADIFGFGEYIHRANPKAWHKLKKDWNTKGFPELPVYVKSDAKIRRTGTTGNSYISDVKE